MTQQTTTPWMNTEEAAAYIGIRPKTLKIWRMSGRGPQFSKIGNRVVRYNRETLDLWLINANSEEPRRAAG